MDEWDACVRGGECYGYLPDDEDWWRVQRSFLRGDPAWEDYADDEDWGRGSFPVTSVNWEEAQAYVEWLSERTGAAYRLPSESEWEYAARAGTTTPFHTGATILTDQANYNGNSVYGSGRRGTYRERTTPTGTFAPNEFGLYDVHGNVWEWVQDCWHYGYEILSKVVDRE